MGKTTLIRSRSGSSIAARAEVLERRWLLSADLVGAFESDLPAALSFVHATRVGVRIENEGDAAISGSVTVKLYASPGASFDPATAVLLQTALPKIRLSVHSQRELVIKVPPPNAVADGDYYLVGQIDGEGADAFHHVFNSANPVRMRRPVVNLVTEFTRVPDTAILTDGTHATRPKVQVRLVNIGDAAARGTVRLSLFLSSGRVLDASALLAAQTRPLNLRVGAGSFSFRRFTIRIVLPPGTMPGRYTLFAVAEPDHRITQSNPSNLIAAATQPVIVQASAPDAFLLANYQKHSQSAVHYDGVAYCADSAFVYGGDDVVVQGEEPPPDFVPAPDPPGDQPTAPSTQPDTQPSPDNWDSGLIDAAAMDQNSKDTSGGEATGPDATGDPTTDFTS